MSTAMAELQMKAEVSVKCPECGHEHMIEPITRTPIPGTTFSFAQKVFPFKRRYGIGTFGASTLAGKTMYFAVREMERLGPEPEGVTEVADAIGKHVHELVVKAIDNLADAPDNWSPVGFQVVGYDENEAKTVMVMVGKTPRKECYTQPGCTASGERRLVEAIWGLYKDHPEDRAAIPLFSLQDAIDYAEFLIRATASYQRFSTRMPTVGGDIDIGLITPFHGFKWIQQKKLSRIIGSDDE